MRAVGCDVSSRKLAFASFNPDGTIRDYVAAVDPSLRGARRLMACRIATVSAMTVWFPDASVVVVEIPWAKAASSFALLSIASVVMEAAQATCPEAIVLDVPTPSWKKGSVGHGNALKSQCMTHAQSLGYEGGDQDVADSVCMADFGLRQWKRAA